MNGMDEVEVEMARRAQRSAEERDKILRAIRAWRAELSVRKTRDDSENENGRKGDGKGKTRLWPERR